MHVFARRGLLYNLLICSGMLKEPNIDSILSFLSKPLLQGPGPSNVYEVCHQEMEGEPPPETSPKTLLIMKLLRRMFSIGLVNRKERGFKGKRKSDAKD